MKIELTRAEVEKILLDYANKIVGCQYIFNRVEGGGYRDLPSSVVLTRKEDEHTSPE